ncbi:Cytochrome P450 monooxygenase ascH [Cladobotryum mycophilum]|uniref:Cytochrome P450 monooxygenase ascH n=1 Tax=Cladobotryum mycophilum TaxID=491253 RepID=A0ABR0SCX7_9HYPO
MVVVLGFPLEGDGPLRPWLTGAAGLITIFLVISRIQSFLTYRKLSTSNGCSPPPTYPNGGGMLGLKLLRRLIKAKKEMTVPTAFSSIFDDTGTDVHTNQVYILGMKTIWTRDPENIKAVLSSSFKDWCLPPSRVVALKECWGGGIFGAEGAEWEHSRAMLRPSFNRSQVQDTEIMEKHAQNLIDIIKDDETVDLAKIFPLFTMDIGTEILFGESAGCLDPAKSAEGMEFTTAFNYIIDKMSKHISFPLLAKLPDAKLKRYVKYINDYTDFFVSRAMKIRDDKAKTGGSGEDDEARGKRYVFLLEELAKGDYTPVQIRTELLSIMVAGRDTTSSLLSIIWWHLSRRPDIVRRLREELQPLGSEPPSSKELKSLKYLESVVNEVLRLYPINPVNSRCAKRDTVLPRGGGEDGRSPIFVKEGERVIFSSSALHRRKDIWGDDALEIKPERWETHRQAAWEYLPFGGGPRICIGQHLTVTEAAYTTARLIQAFQHIEPKTEGPFQEAFAMVITSGDGCKVSFRRNA